MRVIDPLSPFLTAGIYSILPPELPPAATFSSPPRPGQERVGYFFLVPSPSLFFFCWRFCHPPPPFSPFIQQIPILPFSSLFSSYYSRTRSLPGKKHKALLCDFATKEPLSSNHLPLELISSFPLETLFPPPIERIPSHASNSLFPFPSPFPLFPLLPLGEIEMRRFQAPPVRGK